MQLDNLPKLDVVADVPVTYNDDGEPVMGFRIVGKDSEQYRKQAKENKAAAFKRGAVKRTQIDAKTSEGAAELVDLVECTDRSLAEAVVVDWYGFTSNRQAAVFDKALVKELFDKYPTWVDKVSLALENDSNFMKS